MPVLGGRSKVVLSLIMLLGAERVLISYCGISAISWASIRGLTKISITMRYLADA